MDIVSLCVPVRAYHSWSSRMLDILEDFLVLRQIPYARLDGGTSRPRRTLDIKLVSRLVKLGF